MRKNPIKKLPQKKYKRKAKLDFQALEREAVILRNAINPLILSN